MTSLVTLFDRKLYVLQKLAKSTIFGIFNELLSTQYVNVARFARNVECDFFRDFQNNVDNVETNITMESYPIFKSVLK